MGLRGPPPKPTDIRILEGNLGRLPLNPHEPQYDRTAPDKPDGISPAASKIWDDLVREMGGSKRGSVLRRVDQRALWQLAEDEALLADAYRGLWKLQQAMKRKARAEKKGDIGAVLSLIAMPSGQRAMSSIRDLAQRVVLERREFGLTPASRTRVALEAATSSPAASLESKLCG